MKKNLFSLHLFLPHKFLMLILCLTLLLGTTARPVQAATITVNRIDDPAAPAGRTCLTTPTDCSLRGAILAANANPGTDTINLSAVTYTLALSGTGEEAAATGDLDITESLTIIGAGASKTTINGGSIDRVFESRPAAGATLNINISGVTITGGSLPNVIGNIGTAFAARGLTTGVTNLIMSEVVIKANTNGNNGGGIALLKGSSATDPSLSLDRSTISDNTALNGGGIFCTNCSMNITNTAITGNIATTTGTGGVGGGINFGGTSAMLTLTNSTVSGNTAFSNGGGIARTGGSTHIVVEFSTITRNIADSDTNGGDGGGIYNTSSVLGGDFKIKNSIVQDNTDSSTFANNDCAGDSIISGTYNVVGSSTGCPSGGIGDITSAANLGALADNGGPTDSHLPGTGSTAIDRIPTGTNGCTSGVAVDSITDQRSVVRAVDTAFCDSGAIEVDTATPAYRRCELSAGQTYDMEAGVYVQVNILNTLSCVTVTHYSTNHPNATPRLQTGKYWNIDAAGATDFNVSLTLPDVLTIPRICKHISGSTWDCPGTGQNDNDGSVTLENITSFSDWTVGEDPGLTAVQLERFGAAQGIPALGLLGALAALAILAIALRRKPHSA